MTSTPEERFERGVYDSSVDAEVTDAMREQAAESHANALSDVREMIDNQVDLLCGDDLDSHFTLQSVLAGLIRFKRQENNG